MQIASFTVDGRRTYGVASNEIVTEASDAFRGQYQDLRSVLTAGALAELESDSGGGAFNLSELEFLPTVPNPDKVICVGVNYRSHLEEMGHDIPDNPVLFVRFAASQTGHGQPIMRPRVSEHYDFEGELAIVIGRPARYVNRESAFDHVAGYCCFMDGTLRDWQKHGTQFTPGKNFHRSGAMGPYLVTSDEIADPALLRLETCVNGEVMQQGALSDLIFDIPALIEYCSTFAELLPGDVISTGTPGGVGAARKPPVWLAEGDRVVVDIEGVGRLENVVRDE